MMTGSLHRVSQQWVDWLFKDNQMVELRYQTAGNKFARWASELFLEPAALVARAGELGRANVYTSINRPIHMTRAGAFLSDRDFGAITRFVIDLDPVRSDQQSGSADGITSARSVAKMVASYLQKRGWHPPALAISGNGAHLIWRLANPHHPHLCGTAESPAFRDLRRRALHVLSEQFSTDMVRVDCSVFNASRIWRLYGIPNWKNCARHGSGRPTSIDIPASWLLNDPRLIRELAYSDTEICASRTSTGISTWPQHRLVSGQGDYSSLDVVAWFRSHGLYRRYLRAGKHSVYCPWEAEHSTRSLPSDSDSIIFEADGGWPGFFCHHQHCIGRNIISVMSLFGDADCFCAIQYVPTNANGG